ncbi:MAG TPA: hypothetical protein VNT75_08205 [Symbiobacteriaceae bacterium]|nr:hypothetical protein [Symbiobacteriaceae bacterium]
MNAGTTLTFLLPDGWTIRQVASTLVREWLPAFRAQPAPKAARWVVQSVMESSDAASAPLWEPGISTEEYEARLDSADLNWVIRATAGRGKGTVLARFVPVPDRPDAFELICYPAAFPDALFDAPKMEQVSRDYGAGDAGNVFAAILTSHGLRMA